MKKRPIAVTVLGCLYIVVGIASPAFHLTQSNAYRSPRGDLLWIAFIGALALVAGVFMLLRQNWARWLALAWMAFHVALSVFHPLHELILHSALLVAFIYLLFRPDAQAYFRSSPASMA